MEIRAIIAGSGVEEESRLEYLLADTEIHICGRITDVSRGIDTLECEKPGLLIITGAYDRKMQMFCQQVYILYPMCAMVLLAEEADKTLYGQAMESGIRRIIAPYPDRLTLVGLLKESYINEKTHQEHITGKTGGRPRTEVILVTGAKGGIGKTALAVNLAARLAMSKRKAILLDCNLQYGDTGVFLGMEPRETMAELLQEQRNPTLDTIDAFLAYHQSGLRVLFGPKSPEYADLIGGKNIEKIISVLRNYYDYIIIDTAVGFSEVNLTLLDLCSRILFVSQSDLCTLRNTKKAFLLLQSLNMEQKVKAVLMEQAGKSDAIGRADVERVLGRKVDITISRDDKTMAACLNQGRPVVLAAGKSKLAADYGNVAGLVERGFSADKSPKQKIPVLPNTGKRKLR